jgi:hypothetical protein
MSAYTFGGAASAAGAAGRVPEEVAGAVRGREEDVTEHAVSRPDPHVRVANVIMARLRVTVAVAVVGLPGSRFTLLTLPMPGGSS